MKQPPLNAKWLKNQLDSRGITQRKLAKGLKLGPSAISKLMSGGRKLKTHEVNELASFLGIPIEEVLQNAGGKSTDHETSKTIKIGGWLDGELKAHWEAPQGPKIAPAIAGEPNAKVLRIQSAGSKFDSLDGALVYYRPMKEFDRESVGRMCLVSVSGKTDQRLRVVRRGYVAGKYNLASLSGDVLEEGVVIASTSPVIWLKL